MNSPVADHKHRLERGEPHAALARRRAGHHQQAVVAARAQTGDGAHRVAAEPVGDQPLAQRGLGEGAADLRAEHDLHHP